MQKENEAILIQYLLGELNEEESEQMEENYFVDKDLFERLLIVEDELIDDYISNKLSVERVKRFEERYLHEPQRRERVEAAAVLQKYMSDRSKSSDAKLKSAKRPAKDYYLYLSMAATILALVGIAWLLTERAQLKEALDASNAERAALERDQDDLKEKIAEESSRNQLLSRELEERRNRNAEPLQDNPKQGEGDKEEISVSLATFIFTASSATRSGSGGNKFTIRPNVKQVSIQAFFKSEDYRSYKALLTTVEGEEIFARIDLKTQTGKTNKSVAFKMPAELFKEQDYFLTLMGADASGKSQKLAEYSFRVVKK